jgi:hypothetical protein
MRDLNIQAQPAPSLSRRRRRMASFGLRRSTTTTDDRQLRIRPTPARHLISTAHLDLRCMARRDSPTTHPMCRTELDRPTTRQMRIHRMDLRIRNRTRRISIRLAGLRLLMLQDKLRSRLPDSARLSLASTAASAR